jgi:hypothetical protein
MLVRVVSEQCAGGAACAGAAVAMVSAAAVNMKTLFIHGA